MSKPSWKDAPDWAQWLAQDEGGIWNWYKEAPYMGDCLWVGISTFAALDDKCDGWRYTLEPRPTDDKKEQDMTDETMTFPEVLRQMVENVEDGKKRGDGMEIYKAHYGDWGRMDASDLDVIKTMAVEGSIRRTPRAIEVAGVQVPEPMREAPEIGTWYWHSDGASVVYETWDGSDRDYARLETGNAFMTRDGVDGRIEAERRLFGPKESDQ